jgi:hypothetical protein
METLEASCLFLFKHKRRWAFYFFKVYRTAHAVDPFLLSMIFRTRFQSTASGPYHQSHAMPIAYNWSMRRVSALAIILSISPPPSIPINIRKYILVLVPWGTAANELAFTVHLLFCIQQYVCLFNVQYLCPPTVPQDLPPLRFHCVRGCWDRTQSVFVNLLSSPGIDSQPGGIDSWAP